MREYSPAKIRSLEEASAVVAAALLCEHAINTLGARDTAFVVVTRLAGSVAVAALCALAAATARAREEYLESKSRLARLQEDLVAAFAHDIRSPLNAILGYASMLEEEAGGPGSPELMAGLERIRANALRVEQMVQEMLSFDRAEGTAHNVVAQFGADELFAMLRAELDPTARARGQEIAWLVEPGTPPLETDQRKLLSVLRNLINNALKYAPGGPIRVRVRFEAKDGRHEIEVSDSGPGIPRHALPHVFDRFYRVGGERDRDGFGLGLFIVKRMMEMLGGEVRVESEIGRGSRFVVSIPRLSRPAAAPAPAAPRKALGA